MGIISAEKYCEVFRMKLTRLAFLLIFVFAISAAAQTAEVVSLKKAEIKKVEKFVGTWEGSGWRQIGPQRENVTGAEIVQLKVDGTALLIEGRFVDHTGSVKHETLAVMSYDEKSKAHKFRSYLANGMTGEFDLKVLADSFEWGFPVQAGTVRFTIRLENDTWFEIGEFSRDGKTWVKTLEMTLKRKK